MKHITFDFERLIFQESSLIECYSYDGNTLYIETRFMGISVGEGEDIQFLDLPEADLTFKGVTACHREIGEFEFGSEEAKRTYEEVDPLPEIKGLEGREYGFCAKSAMPPGNVEWNIRAEKFEMEIEDEVLTDLQGKGFQFTLIS